MTVMESKIRHAAWEDQFYPGNKTALSRMIDEYLAGAPDLGPGKDIIGFAVPHAGYVYSGPTAAAAYRQVSGRAYNTVIVIAPSHAERISGISVYDGDYYETVFGQVAIDKELAVRLTQKDKTIYLSEDGHRTSGDRAEHALEVQLPFLQKTLAHGWQLVPMVFHDYSYENCRLLGEAIAECVQDKNVLIVASSDLYHGYSYSECLETDDRTLKSVESMDVEEFCRGVDNQSYQACGAGPIAALLVAGSRLGASRAKVIARTTSGDVTGVKHGWIVGYASVMVSK
jgi:MEMO1 family protein